MNKYDVFYKTKDNTVEKKNITGKEVYDFIGTLKKQDESELRVKEVKAKEGEER